MLEQLQSWIDEIICWTIRPLSFSRLFAQLDQDPGRRGFEFERICAWYLRNAPEYRRRFRKVWLWSDWPDAWAADAGIDLVAEEHDGDL